MIKISEISDNNIEVNQISDEIKMNISSYLTELRFHVANKARLREISIQTNMEIIRFNQIPVFFIVGKVSYPGTTRAKAMSLIKLQIRVTHTNS